MKTNSILQRVRDHVQERMEKEVNNKFKEMNAFTSKHNISAELSMAVQKPAYYGDILKAVRSVKKSYTSSIRSAIEYRDSLEDRLKDYAYRNGNRLSKFQIEKYKEKIDVRFENMMNEIIERTNSDMTALEMKFNVPSAVIGLAAYDVTYTEGNIIDRNVSAGIDPTRGLSFPWSGAKYQLLSAVRAVSGKDMSITNIKKPVASGVVIRMGNITCGVDPAWIKDNALSKGCIYIYVQPISNENDPLYGIYEFNVYVGRVKVGTLFADNAHMFSGHDKWIVKIKHVSYKPSKNSNIVKTISFELDDVTPYLK